LKKTVFQLQFIYSSPGTDDISDSLRHLLRTWL
jgi:hypothetical protein